MSHSLSGVFFHNRCVFKCCRVHRLVRLADESTWIGQRPRFSLVDELRERNEIHGVAIDRTVRQQRKGRRVRGATPRPKLGQRAHFDHLGERRSFRRGSRLRRRHPRRRSTRRRKGPTTNFRGRGSGVFEQHAHRDRVRQTDQERRRARVSHRRARRLRLEGGAPARQHLEGRQQLRCGGSEHGRQEPL